MTNLHRVMGDDNGNPDDSAVAEVWPSGLVYVWTDVDGDQSRQVCMEPDEARAWAAAIIKAIDAAKADP